jgi:hypothetical protein
VSLDADPCHGPARFARLLTVAPAGATAVFHAVRNTSRIAFSSI